MVQRGDHPWRCSGNVQEMFRCCTNGRGLVRKLLVVGGLDDLIDLFQP